MSALAQNQTPDLETHAALFLRDVRDIFQNSDKGLSGAARLQEKDLKLIYKTSAKAVLPRAEFNTQGLVTPLAKLMERLEEGCRRNKVSVDPALRPALAQILLLELCENIRAFGFEKKPEKMIPLTLYQGIGFLSVKTEAKFADFADSPSLFKYAAVGYPKDPRGFLRKVQGDIAAMAGEAEFAEFADSPSLFQRAAVHNPKDPRGFLRKVQGDIAAMAGEAEFADSPSIFKYAAANNPKDPRGFLRQVQADIAAMAGEVEFAAFADSPSIFKYAAVNNPKDPRKFLREVRDGKKPMPNGSGFFVPPAPQ